MPHHRPGRDGAATRGATAGRLGGAVNTVLKASLGAGIAVLGTYVLQRGRQHTDLVARLDRLDALVKEMEKKGDGSGG